MVEIDSQYLRHIEAQQEKLSEGGFKLLRHPGLRAGSLPRA